MIKLFFVEMCRKNVDVSVFSENTDNEIHCGIALPQVTGVLISYSCQTTHIEQVLQIYR